MPGEDSSRPPAEAFYTVRDPEQARLLTDPVSKEFFKPFVAKERTASQAAAELGCKVNTLLYRVKTFLEAGLLRIAKEEKRAGRSVKHYRSVYDAYFIPFEVTPYAVLEERFAAQLEPFLRDMVKRLARACRDNGVDGQRFYRNESGGVWTDVAVDAMTALSLAHFRAPVMLFRDTTTRLTKVEASTLQVALNDLFERSIQIGDAEEGDVFTLQVALVPPDSPV